MIVRVNQVVRKTRVIRLGGPQLLEDRGRLQLLGVGLVGRQGRLIHGERIESGRLAVLRIRLVDVLHRALVREHTRALIDGLVVLEFLRHRGDVIPLARCRFPRCLRASDRRRSGLERLGRPQARERVAPVGHRDAPVRDRAGGIFGEHVLESLPRRRKCKRVQQRDRAIEPRGHARRAGRREVHAAELLGRGMFVLGILPGRRRRRTQHNGEGDQSAHEGLLRHQMIARWHDRDNSQPPTPTICTGREQEIRRDQEFLICFF